MVMADSLIWPQFGGTVSTYRILSESSNHTGYHDKICLTGFWDERNAVFYSCFTPIIELVPAAVAVLILLAQIIRFMVPYTPSWISTFVQEAFAESSEIEPHTQKRRGSLHATAIVGLSVIGVALSVARVVRAWTNLYSLLPLLPWVVIIAAIAARVPRTAPMGVLTIFVTQFVARCAILAAAWLELSTTSRGIEVAVLAIIVCSIAIILLMPLRDPRTPTTGISAPFSPPDATLRSPEDNLSLWQFMTVSWMTPMIATGRKRQLNDEDVWQLGYEFQHRRLHANFQKLKGTVVMRLIQANSIDLVIVTILGLLELLAQYSVPVLLQKLLAAMEDPLVPTRSAIIWASLSLGVQLISCQIGVFSLWYGRRCYERSRGEMITMLYEKTLRRKIAFVEKEPGKDETIRESQNGAQGKKERGSVLTRLEKRCRQFFSSKPNPPQVKEPASMGKILNLMRNDVYEVSQRFWEFQTFITTPLGVVIALTLVIQFLGSSGWYAVAWLVSAQMLTWIMSRLLLYIEKKRRRATDSKLQIITQFVEAIRHLRWYGWQNHWMESVLTARQKELTLRVIGNLWRSMINLFVNLGGDLAPAVAFFAYTTIAKQPLRIDIVFPAITLFNLLNSSLKMVPELIITIINAWVAVDRIESFMAEPIREEMNTEALIGDRLALNHASFNWPGLTKPVLQDIDITFPVGLTLVCGEVASGKTALLQALLGELDMLEGQLLRPEEPIGYCAQTPWLQSMSIRENILFSAPYDESRYKDALDACALLPDLAEFKGGDLAMIGENGIGLSGGQKARVALARAVYSRTSILLLDDPLSALDQQTAERIVEKCFRGPLLKDRTVVLVTHRTDLVLEIAQQVIKISDGHATALPSRSPADSSLQRMPSAAPEEVGERQKPDKPTNETVPDKFIEDEHREHGDVKFSVYWEYIRAGKLGWWALLITVLIIFRFANVGGTYFLKIWSEAYERPAELLIPINSVVRTVQNGIDLPFIRDWPPPDVNVKPWLITYASLTVAQCITYVISQCIMLVVVYVAARRIFNDIMYKVAHATFRFYDVTPIGRLMNRMTSDIGVIDGLISAQLSAVAWLSISWVTSVVVVASVTPIFLLFMLLMVITFLAIFMRFLPTSQSLRRLEMVSLTPLMSNFGALLHGLVTVRAFSAQERFQDRVISVVDTFQKMDHFYWSLQAWLMYRYDAISAISAFLLTIIALATNISPGLTAFALVNANKYVLTTHRLCKQYGRLQMEFVSVERVIEMRHLEQEPEGVISPPAWWPSFAGDIVFDNVTIRYAPHLDPALDGVSFTLKGGSKTAIIGRTGSGKSTLALSILATILPTQGKILIDSIDLAEVDKQLLRTRVTFLAQEPVLFPGTMRQNLDPIEEHTDEACATILDRVCGRQGWKLDTPIDAGGKNLSQGQRQLVGLARAVLRRSAIIVLDEATASIDRETAMQIQQVMHEEMKESTVITIAHRLEAVRKADYCIVLGKGKILRQGPAAEMLKEHHEEMDDEHDDSVASDSA